ncbi:hypothetical protein F66182_7639 [Fusarium sp. NRRL 66182]|nr:hypothetical protein F66182_7639 [Fusarium sp. NRRL 66182]
MAASTVRWLLFSDLHFKHPDLDRIRQTANWILTEAKRRQVTRVVVCGDLLTSRTMQPTHVLSECYRFVGLLSDAVPRVHILLGNHDLAYRRDYHTTALEALNINRLAPYISLHKDISLQEWDGRRVLLLPFREEQRELTEAVAALSPAEASKTVAFAHMAIHKAILQRYVVGNGAGNTAASSIRYSGLTGPHHLGPLAQTFTGHFHSYQTITQRESDGSKASQQGKITYLGSPLQLDWADLHDDQRGVVLLDPETLQHEMLVNPHAVGYTTADVQDVLDGRVEKDAVTNKYVKLLGELGLLKYVNARDKLTSLGVRGVHKWTPTAFTMYTEHTPFGSSVPASDASVQPLEVRPRRNHSSDTAHDGTPSSANGNGRRPDRLDFAAEARKYAMSLELDESLDPRREELVRVGQRMIQAASSGVTDQEGDVEFNHQNFLDESPQATSTGRVTDLTGSSGRVFVAEPCTLTVTNFLSVQGTITIDFRHDFQRGLNFIVGENGSGKSTLIEAVVWCQFGLCVRSGMAVNDVINDVVGKNCCVSLGFANGYAITRYRKHKPHGNRVIVSLDGEPQPQFEHPDARTTQAAINELLGIDYKMYVKTIVLSHESAASFLRSNATERRELTESSLGLSILDSCWQVSKLSLKDIDKKMEKVGSDLEVLDRTVTHVEGNLRNWNQMRTRYEKEAADLALSLDKAMQDHATAKLRLEDQASSITKQNDIQREQAHHGIDMSEYEQQMSAAGIGFCSVEASVRSAAFDNSFCTEISTLQDQVNIEQEKLHRLRNSYHEMQEQKHAESTSWLGQLKQQSTQSPLPVPGLHLTMLHRFLYPIKMMVIMGILRILRALKGDYQGTDINGQETALNSLLEDIKTSATELQDFKSKAKRIIELKQEATNLTVTMIEQQLAENRQAIQTCKALEQQSLLEQQIMFEEQKAILEKQEAIMHNQKQQVKLEQQQQEVMLRKRDAAHYTELVDNQQKSLDSLQVERTALVLKRQGLAVDRELFAFWSSALSKRASRISSSTSTKSTAKSTANFREYILKNSLSELNALLAQILTVLYDDTRHTHAMATGILHSLFESETDDEDMNTCSSPGPILDQTLAVHHSLAYYKRSGGERKRVDLALFFAILQLGWARSAHRAQYLLVDEVFDSLDVAGQEAVVRWCHVMSQTMIGWIVMVTHSRFLIERDPEKDRGRALVVNVRIGKQGTELSSDGRRIGIQGRARNSS